VHGSRGNAENVLVPTRRSFGGDPEKERDEDRKYDVSVIPYASRISKHRARIATAKRDPTRPEESGLPKVSIISARRYVRNREVSRVFVLD